jgi:hypothetical protein
MKTLSIRPKLFMEIDMIIPRWSMSGTRLKYVLSVRNMESFGKRPECILADVDARYVLAEKR